MNFDGETHDDFTLDDPILTCCKQQHGLNLNSFHAQLLKLNHNEGCNCHNVREHPRANSLSIWGLKAMFYQ